MLTYWISIFRLRRVGRWARRTVWLLGQMRADFGLGGTTKPVWLRDNPFLLKAGRAEARRPGLSLRLAVTIAVLGGLLLGGLSLEEQHGFGLRSFLLFFFGPSLPSALFALLAFVHVLLIVNARTAGAVVLADEARRATLPDLLMTPLRRAEMLLAMGVGPARSAFFVALAGLPVYGLLGQFGGLTLSEALCLYLLFALLCYQPPVYGVPALSGLGQTPEAAPGQFAPVQGRRAARRTGTLGPGFPAALSFLFLAQALGAIGGGWLAHFFSALHLPISSGFPFLLFLTWPYYAALLLSGRLPFFGAEVSPLWYVLPVIMMQWAGSALSSASALSAGSLDEMRRSALWTRAQTLLRWTARLTAFCGLAVVWRAWVESGDTAGLAGLFASGRGWNAAGLLTLLGGVSLPNVCHRALAADPRTKMLELRPSGLVLRRALKRSVRPLGVALPMFLLVCACGRLSPFAPPVYEVAGKIAGAGLCSVFWAVGVRRALPKINIIGAGILLYGLPIAALSSSTGLGGSVFAALSPASAWVRLFAGGPGLVSRFPWWPLATLPPFWVCAAGPFIVGTLLMLLCGRQTRQVEESAVPVPARAPARNAVQTAALMAWVTRRTDNPLFTYEMRTRTRSGQWFNALALAPLIFVGLVVAALTYPSFVDGFSDMSPFKFFPDSVNLGNAMGVKTGVLLAVASILLSVQCVMVGLRGQIIGERLIAKDREQGTWGFLLISPLPMSQIFWGKMLGQTAAVGAAWAGASLACFLLYAVSAPLVGIGPALGVWASGQLFVAALFVLGAALGASLASFPVMQKTLRGLSTVLFVVFLGASGFAEYIRFGLPSGWRAWSGLLGVSGLSALALAAGLFWVAERRLAILRGRDVATGDGTG